MSALNKTLDGRQLRNAYGHFPTGVTALCALCEGHPVGMAASSFMPVSLEPPLVSVCVSNRSRTWSALSRLSRLGVSVLAESQDGACRQLAAATGDRFAGLEWESAGEGAVFIKGAPVWFDCSIHDRFAAGDHVIVLLRIEGLMIYPGIHPLVFHGSEFRHLDVGPLKPKTQIIPVDVA
ncbi:flavin reductase family protein [Bradyrhizobium sp. KBS0727]|nr:flavin reductase family protein [Bradyrhizobium sp. KBS0725]QDW47215.1 flavin reductase family protein [Bradyrhizobium sp. KBS0727]